MAEILIYFTSPPPTHTHTKVLFSFSLACSLAADMVVKTDRRCLFIFLLQVYLWWRAEEKKKRLYHYQVMATPKFTSDQTALLACWQMGSASTGQSCPVCPVGLPIYC